jgi:hypothetical protein
MTSGSVRVPSCAPVLLFCVIGSEGGSESFQFFLVTSCARLRWDETQGSFVTVRA